MLDLHLLDDSLGSVDGVNLLALVVHELVLAPLLEFHLLLQSSALLIEHLSCGEASLLGPLLISGCPAHARVEGSLWVEQVVREGAALLEASVQALLFMDAAISREIPRMSGSFRD